MEKIYVRGKITARGTRKRADYILYYKPNIPIAIIEAKDNNHSVRAGIQQGLDYARILDIPCVFSSNGDGFLFHVSLATLKFISLLDDSLSVKNKVLFGLRGIDMMLNDFGYIKLSEKREFANVVSKNYFEEFGLSEILKKQFNTKYKNSKKIYFRI